MTAPRPSFDVMLKRWQIAATGRLSNDTIANYVRDIEGFRKSVGSPKRVLLRAEEIEEYASSLPPARRRRALSAIRNFSDFAAEELGKRNPARLITSKNLKKSLRDLLIDAQVPIKEIDRLSFADWLSSASRERSTLLIGKRTIEIPKAQWRRLAREFARGLYAVQSPQDVKALLAKPLAP